jgi:hypothetical protein
MHGKMVKTPDLEGSVPTGGQCHPLKGRATPNELGLSGYPRAPPLSISWRQAEGGAELACSRVAAMHDC